MRGLFQGIRFLRNDFERFREHQQWNKK